MAKDRVIGFLHDLVGDPKLNKSVAQVGRTPSAWIDAANESGYDFSVNDLKMVSEEITQKELTDDSLIPELVDTLTTNGADATANNGASSFVFSPQGISRLKAVMQQGRYSGYYRPW